MELRTLGPGFGAEVRDAGLAEAAFDEDVYAAVRAAFETHSVLLFRNQRISDELQVAFSRRFGPLETAKAASLGEGTPFSILTNVDRATSALVPPEHKEALRARANQLWHTDSCFKAPPALASILSARTIPTNGGETEFASTRCAWERISAGVDRRTDRLRNCTGSRLSAPLESGRRDHVGQPRGTASGTAVAGRPAASYGAHDRFRNRHRWPGRDVAGNEPRVER